MSEITCQCPQEWEKTLWRQQSFSDSYIPTTSFLSSLKKNTNFRPYTYWSLVLLSCAVAQHVSTIFIFLATFVRLREHLLDARTVVWATIGCFITGYAIWDLLHRPTDKSDSKSATRLKALKSSILMFLALMSLSPVLRTLTAATSSDSIWALSAFLFLLNILLADYTSVDSDEYARERLTSVLSKNAAVSASVVLASRLTTDFAVFALTLLSIQAFALFPILCHRLRASPTVIQASLTFLLSLSAVTLTASLSGTVTCIFSATLMFVIFLAPALLMWAQRYKNEISGPWDVAVPKVN